MPTACYSCETLFPLTWRPKARLGDGRTRTIKAQLAKNQSHMTWRLENGDGSNRTPMTEFSAVLTC